MLPLSPVRARVLLPFCGERLSVFDPDSFMRQKRLSVFDPDSFMRQICAPPLGAPPMSRLPKCPENGKEAFVIVAGLLHFDHALLCGDLPFEVPVYGYDDSVLFVR